MRRSMPFTQPGSHRVIKIVDEMSDFKRVFDAAVACYFLGECQKFNALFFYKVNFAVPNTVNVLKKCGFHFLR